MDLRTCLLNIVEQVEAYRVHAGVLVPQGTVRIALYPYDASAAKAGADNNRRATQVSAGSLQGGDYIKVGTDWYAVTNPKAQPGGYKEDLTLVLTPEIVTISTQLANQTINGIVTSTSVKYEDVRAALKSTLDDVGEIGLREEYWLFLSAAYSVVKSDVVTVRGVTYSLSFIDSTVTGLHKCKLNLAVR